MDRKRSFVFLFIYLCVLTICKCHQSDSSTEFFNSPFKHPSKSWNFLSKRYNNDVSRKFRLASSIDQVWKHYSFFNFNNIKSMTRDEVNVTSTNVAYSNSTVDSTLPVVPLPLLVAVTAAAVALAVGVAVPVSLSTAAGDNRQINPLDETDIDNILNFDDQSVGEQIPENDLDIPVDGLSFPDDGCGDGSIRFSNGTCYPVFKRGPCNPRSWVTVDPFRLQGRCTPRLCGRLRVFNGHDELCHDINDKIICRGGRRLYYTAYGDPICDCPIGQYPFPRSRDDCVSIFTQGPCPAGNIVSIDPEGILGCTPTRCRSIDGRDNPFDQLIPFEDGFCYPLGSRGPCPPIFQFLGYDIFKRQSVCVNVLDPASPYFSTPQENQLIDNVYDQFTAEFGDLQAVLIQQNQVKRKDTADRRQEINTLGVFQVPGSFPEPLLQPCRPGTRRSINYKCTNPLLSRESSRVLLQAARSLFRCPSNTVLQATAQCANDNRAASCGPSYRYDQLTGQCRSIL